MWNRNVPHTLYALHASCLTRLPPRSLFTTMDPESEMRPLPAASGPAALEDLSPMEQAVLEEYERLAENMKQLANVLGDLAGRPTADTLDGLRELERKTSLVFTLLKASVYSIVLQHQMGE